MPNNRLLQALPAFCAAASLGMAVERPKIVYILADDLAQGDLGCYGQKLIQTPHLDRLAREGTRFTHAYCGTAVCAPSRASLLTGLHSGHSPIRANRELQPEGQMPLPEDVPTVAQVLKSAGYATACMGKWGMGMFESPGSPLKKGFDHFFGYNCQRHAHSYFPTYLYDDDRRVGLPENAGGAKRTYAQELIQRDVEQWVRTNASKPFFLFYAVTLPHAQHEIDDLGIYADKDWTPLQKAYAAQVTRLDADVGRLMSLLKDLGIDKRTLVIVSGDNGSSFAPDSPIGSRFDQTANGLRGYKRSLYEGALRQASLARWPGVVPAGRVSDEPWAFWDFLPTAAELAGAALPSGFKTDGLSLVGFLKGGSAPTRPCFYWELHEGAPGTQQAVRFGNWKAVRDGQSPNTQIYDLARDPGERVDLASRHPDIVRQAEALMRDLRVDSPAWPLR